MVILVVVVVVAVAVAVAVVAVVAAAVIAKKAVHHRGDCFRFGSCLSSEVVFLHLWFQLTVAISGSQLCFTLDGYWASPVPLEAPPPSLPSSRV